MKTKKAGSLIRRFQLLRSNKLATSWTGRLPGVSPDGKFQFDYDHDVFDLIVKSFKRTWIKCYAGWISNLKNGIFPVKMELFLANTAVLTIIFLAGYDPTFGIMQYLVSWLNWCCSNWLNL